MAGNSRVEQPQAEQTRKDVLRETDAEAIRLAKTLVRSARYGALAVIEAGTGAPLASRVALATDLDGSPIILELNQACAGVPLELQ